MLMLPNVFHSQTIKNIDEIAPFSEGLAAVRQGDQWGFINEEGQMVINFRSDIYWNRDADTTKKDISGVQYPMFNEGSPKWWRMVCPFTDLSIPREM